MGCVSSKKVLRTNSFRQNLHRPFPILENFLLANNPDQFVALICKTSSFRKKLNAATEIESLPSFISEDNEGEESVNENFGTEVLDLQVEISVEEEEPKKHKATEEESEQNKAEEDKPVIVINTWDLMAGLEDEEAGQTLENPADNIEMPRVAITGRRLKHVECFHTLEEYDSFLATNRGSLWNRNSKRYLYYLGHKNSEMVTESIRQCKTSSLPSLKPKPRNMTAVVIDWKEDSKDDGNCAPESSVLKTCLGQSDTRIEDCSQENNISERVAESNCSEEANHIPETNIGNSSPTERNLEKKQCKERTSVKTRLHESAKVNELVSINIPSSPDLSTVGSLRDWLYSGGHLYSPGVSSSTTPRFGSYGHGDKWPKLEDNSNSRRFLADEAEIEIHSCCALDDNETTVNTMDSSAYCDSNLSPIEDFPLFYPELLASLETALEQLSEEEKYILRHIDEHLNLPGSDYYPRDSEHILQDNSEDIQIQIEFHSNQEQNSSQFKDAQEMCVAS